MATIIVIAVILPLVLAAGGAHLALRARRDRRQASLASVIVIFTAVMVGLFVTVGVVLWRFDWENYRECKRSVDDSVGDRNFDDYLIAKLTSVDDEVRSKLGVQLASLEGFPQEARSALDRFLPKRTYAECDKP